MDEHLYEQDLVPADEIRPPSKKGFRLCAVQADELMAERLPDVNYIVPGYIAEGLTILAGRPKLGKSWMSLGLAVAIAGGGKVFGDVDVESGGVLYLALEDNKRRMQSRLRQLVGEQDPPRRLALVFDRPVLDKGGLAAIEDWLESNPDARMIVIDVFAKVRPKAAQSDNGYEADYKALAPLKRLADDRAIAILVVHHVRKMPADDPFDTVSGTTGFTGAADSVLILDRGPQGATLYGRGRDIQEFEAALSFDHRTGRWKAEGAANDVRRSDERKAILKALEDAGEAVSPNDIAHEIGTSPNNVRQLLRKMTKAGEVEKLGRGRYSLPPDSAVPPENDNFDTVDTDECDAFEAEDRSVIL